MRDRILGEDRHAVGVNELRNAVVDLRINVVRSSAQNDSMSAGVTQVIQRLLTLAPDIFAAPHELSPRIGRSSPDIFLVNIAENVDKPVCQDFFTCECEERIHEFDIRITQFLHIVFNVLSVGGDDRAVVMVDRAFELLALVGNARIENELYSVPKQP